MDPSPKPAGACPDAEQLVQFARGQLVGAAHSEVLEHARDCEECGGILAAFTKAPTPRPLPVDAAADTAFAFGPLSTAGAGAASVKIGELIDQKYRVRELIGAGGMGVVVAATHVQIGHAVALKFMRPEACQSADGVARFMREARACAQIQSEHVARLLDVGRLEGGGPYMVMELLTGTDLGVVLQTRGPLALEEAIDVVLQAGEAVAEAHRLGIVHRDLKPANLFLTQRPDGTALVKVLDFGISKLSADASDTSVGLTSSRVLIGSPRYMSPEQLNSPRDVGPAADVWAFGCILYELVTGRPAFSGETVHSIGVAISTKPAPKARTTHADLPRLVDEVIEACLEKDPAQRLRSVADLALRLSPLAPARSRVSIDRICRLTGRPPPIAPDAPARGGARLPLAAGVVALVALASVAVVAANRHDEKPSAPSTTTATLVAGPVTAAEAVRAPGVSPSTSGVSPSAGPELIAAVSPSASAPPAPPLPSGPPRRASEPTAAARTSPTAVPRMSASVSTSSPSAPASAAPSATTTSAPDLPSAQSTLRDRK
jgi:serine/threonine protein kinase